MSFMGVKTDHLPGGQIIYKNDNASVEFFQSPDQESTIRFPLKYSSIGKEEKISIIGSLLPLFPRFASIPFKMVSFSQVVQLAIVGLR